jgi:putative hemolysin
MSDLPNPIGAFEIFKIKKERIIKSSKSGALKKLSKKLAKKLFGKKFATKAREQLSTTEAISSIKPSVQVKAKKAAFQISWASNASEIKEAQRLRYKVFAEEMGANLSQNLEGLDIDEFDAYCDHLLIRDQDSLKVVGTYRVLPPHKAQELGRLYSDSKFDLTRLNHLRPKLVELGR